MTFSSPGVNLGMDDAPKERRPMCSLYCTSGRASIALCRKFCTFMGRAAGRAVDGWGGGGEARRLTAELGAAPARSTHPGGISAPEGAARGVGPAVGGASWRAFRSDLDVRRPL